MLYDGALRAIAVARQEYHKRRLLEANVRKQIEPVVEVERLVRDLRDAWAQMLGQQDGVTIERVRGVA